MEQFEILEKGIREIAEGIIALDNKVGEIEEWVKNNLKEIEKRFDEYERKRFELAKMGIAGDDKIRFYEVLGEGIKRIISERGSNYTVAILRDGKLSPEFRAVITPADLANLVEPEFLREVYRVASEFGLARQLFTVIPVTANSIKTNKADGFVSVYWRSRQTGSQTRETALPAISPVNVNLEWLDALVVLAKDSIRFTSFALGNFITEKLGEGFAKYEDFVAFQGVAANDIYDGAITVATNVYSLSTGKTSYTQATADDFKNAIDTLPLRFQKGGAFVMHPKVVSVLEKQKDSQGNYILTKPTEGGLPTLWGYPVYKSEELPSVDGPGRIFAIFGNFNHSRFYVYQDVSFDITDQASVLMADNTTVNLWQRDALAIRGAEMIAFSHFFPNAYVVLKTATT